MQVILTNAKIEPLCWEVKEMRKDCPNLGSGGLLSIHVPKHLCSMLDDALQKAL